MLKVGICSFTLLLHEGASLKEKRMVVRSLTQKINSRYNVSIAEVGEQDKWQRAEIGFSCVSNNRRHVERMIQEVLRFVESDGRAEVMDIHQEIL
jgi:uncharacterized protein